jgi:D-glycero-alpha-D-manno-heptose-7-phosphate kinase
MDQGRRATRDAVRTRAPTRIDFGGGWTDVPPYCERERGYVCNVAISRYATATVGEGAPTHNERDDELISAAITRSGLSHIRVTTANDFPVGAGLGGSSAASAAVLGALAAWNGGALDACAIAEAGRVIEVEDLGVAGGRQDHYAATHGGALGLEFTGVVGVRRLELGARTRAELERRALVVYTGQSRISGDTITAVLNAYLERDRRVCNALKVMKTLAEEMADVVMKGDVDHLGALVEEHWASQRTLNVAIPTPLIDEIITRAAKSGACGSKALGASGGGCVLVIAKRDRVEDVRAAIAPLGTLLDYTIDVEGLVHMPEPAPAS